MTSTGVQALRGLSELMNRASGQESLQDVLDLIVEGAADVVGFRVAAVSLLQPDGDLEVVAVAGDPGARRELMGRRTPRGLVEAEFDIAEQWGTLRFVPANRLPQTSDPGWVAEGWDAATGEPDSWDPQDTLLAPFYDVAGKWLGMISVDLPLSGKRPDEMQQGLLEVFANQAGIAINGARQRLALAEQIRLAAAVHTVSRISQEVLDPARAVEAVVEPVLEGLKGSAIWVRTFGHENDPAVDSVVAHSGQGTATAPAEVVELVRRVAQRCWRQRTAAMVRSGASYPEGLLTDQEVGIMLGFTASFSGGAVMLAPIGAASECLGHLAIARSAQEPEWSDAEAAAALEMGRDIGRAIVNARLLKLERRLVDQFRQSDRAKTSLFATVAHELKNPLTSIVGHLELLRDDPQTDSDWSLGVMERNTRRLQSLVDDLLTLAKVSDPDRPLVSGQVDLARLTQDAIDMFLPGADQRGIQLTSDLVEGLAVVDGNADELARVVDNLVSNAVKFSPDNGVVQLRTRRDADTVVLLCSDSGLGISKEDQGSLFTEFFRSTNPAALEVPGTGLGLSIVARIIARHGGTISVESELGSGTTFEVALPATTA
ncbi:GAF domain-containing sensor histidine kinase [Pedococcus bigeumensis]|uniref:GAF domain-containing sensor histidine kinase n=1 Tax=Pedococcus bigeumensis TaxID=433644 RepID=UPI0013866B96|nr:GAF domain-containing sensor histidine kinase [Pedococcus bigeumensis]